MKLEALQYTERLTKERVSEVISHIPAGFLSKTEVELLVGVMFEHEGVIGFTNAERGNFS